MISSTFNNILGKTKFELKKLLKKEPFNYDKKVQTIVQDINENSFSVVPDFFTQEECKELREEIDRIIEKRRSESNLWTDELDADNRCFAAEDDSEVVKKFHENSFLLSVAENYFGAKIGCSNTLAARIRYKKGNVGSGLGWHRDGNHFQFKAIVYLSDVEIKDGPFQIIAGSHKLSNVLKDTITMGKDGVNTRFTHEQVTKVIDENQDNYKVLTAKAGTLVFADVSSIHTGMPLSEDGERYTLFNYYYPSYDDVEKRKELFKNIAKTKEYA